MFTSLVPSIYSIFLHVLWAKPLNMCNLVFDIQWFLVIPPVFGIIKPFSKPVFLLQSTPKQLAECVDLLLQLNEPAEKLCEEFLSQ
jgi:hypothetical protein